MPVDGGTIQTIVAGTIGVNFLAVDSTSVFYVDSSQTLRSAPKTGGGTPTLLSAAGAIAWAATTLGSSLYWLERSASPNPTFTLKSEPLSSGTATTITEFTASIGSQPNVLGVTQTTAFVSGFSSQLASFLLSTGVPGGGVPTKVAGSMNYCALLLSDTNAVYCDTETEMVAITSNGTATTLGPVITGNSGALVSAAFDDTNVYWADTSTVGTIMTAPKAGGTVTTLVHDTSPVAVAVDANNVYWSDQGGNIMRLPK
jgi:hypothetical protein